MSTTRVVDRRRVAAARAVHRHRGTQRTRGDTAYLVYVAVLVAAVTGVPLVRTIVLALATPEAMAALGQPGTDRVVTVIAALLWLGALLLGRTRGPIVPPLFVAATLGRSDIAPQTAWGRRMAGATVGVTLLFGGLAALAVSGFLANGEAAGASIAFIGGAALFAMPTTAIWLAGQVLERRAASVLGAVLALLLVAAVFVPAQPAVLPASALAALWPSAHAAHTVPLILLAALAALTLAMLAALLRCILPSSVEDHALRWEAMTMLAATGDLSGALDRTRPRPSTGRRMRIAFARPLVLATLQRAMVGALRTPLRPGIAVVALAASGAGWAWFAQLQHGPRWAAAIGLGLVIFAALGAFSDGFREAADTAGRPALYGVSAGRMLLLALPLPLLVGVIVPPGVVLLVGGDWLAAGVLGALCTVLVALRAYHSTKGALPVDLMMPVPTPMGDASAIGVWAWQADALIWTAAVSFLLATAVTGTPAMLWWAVPIVVLLAALTAGRLRRAAS